MLPLRCDIQNMQLKLKIIISVGYVSVVFGFVDCFLFVFVCVVSLLLSETTEWLITGNNPITRSEASQNTSKHSLSMIVAALENFKKLVYHTHCLCAQMSCSPWLGLCRNNEFLARVHQHIF